MMTNTWCFCSAILFIISSTTTVEGNKKLCPGLYCGKTLHNGTCGACARGYRPNMFSLCEKCDHYLELFDYMYLAFMAILSLTLHWIFIDFTVNHQSFRKLIYLHLMAFMESLLSALLTLLISDPVWSLRLRSCKVNRFSDWYTMLHNPSIDYTETLHCTQEIVYPLYSIVMIYYAISLLLMMMFRPFVHHKFFPDSSRNSIYAALYFLPLLIFLQATLGGVIYFCYPYIVLIISVTTSAIHLANIQHNIMDYTNLQDAETRLFAHLNVIIGVVVSALDLITMQQLVKVCTTRPRLSIILIGHWLLHAFGIISLSTLRSPDIHWSLMALIPLPQAFYILTMSFSGPGSLQM